jgi:hypothetical protein
MQTAYTAPDLDAVTIPPFSVYDGIEGLYADDDRRVDLWSHYHANRVNTCLRITRARIRVFEWQLADVTPRGDAAMVARAAEQLAGAQAELAELEQRRALLEAARVKDSYAPRIWTWE